MSQVLRFVWYRFGGTLRGKRLSLLTIALVVGLVGGLGLGAVAGARRTQSAFADTLAATNTSDLQIQFYSLGSGPAFPSKASPRTCTPRPSRARLRTSPMFERSPRRSRCF